MESTLLNLYLPLAIMAVAGIPHGALDGYLLSKHTRPQRLVVWLTLYMFSAIAVVGLWYVLPTFAILSLLACSTFHFGRGDLSALHCPRNLIDSISLGGTWTIVLPYLQFENVSGIFDMLRCDLSTLKLALKIAFMTWLIAAVFSQCRTLLSPQYHRQRWLWGIGLLIAIFVSPVWALCLYFCGWHAVTHMNKMFSTYHQEKRQLISWMFSLTALTLIAGIALYWIPNIFINVETYAVQVFFVGILALTLPHAIMVDIALPKLQRGW